MDVARRVDADSALLGPRVGSEERCGGLHSGDGVAYDAGFNLHGYCGGEADSVHDHAEQAESGESGTDAHAVWSIWELQLCVEKDTGRCRSNNVFTGYPLN